MHSSDNDSMKSDISEDNLNSGPSPYNPKITIIAAAVLFVVANHQLLPHVPSCTVNSGAYLNVIRDLPNFITASIRSSPPSNYILYPDYVEFAFNYFAYDLVCLKAKILKQDCGIATLATRFGKLQVKLLLFCNLLT